MSGRVISVRLWYRSHFCSLLLFGFVIFWPYLDYSLDGIYIYSCGASGCSDYEINRFKRSWINACSLELQPCHFSMLSLPERVCLGGPFSIFLCPQESLPFAGFGYVFLFPKEFVLTDEWPYLYPKPLKGRLLHYCWKRLTNRNIRRISLDAGE